MGYGSSGHGNSRSQPVAIGSHHASSRDSASKGSASAASSLGNAAPGWNLSAQRRDRKTWSAVKERIERDVGVLALTSVELEEMLRQTLSVSLPNPRIRGEEVAAVVATFAQVLPLSSELLCSEYARFVQKACMKEKVVLSANQLQDVMEFFLQFIKGCSSWYTATAIRALGLVLHDNADRVSSDAFERLFAVLLKYLDPAGVDIEARYAATSCVSNFCTQAAKTSEVQGYFVTLLRMVVENFRQQSLSLTRGDDERILIKACTCSMKCIYTIVNAGFDKLNDRIEAELPSLLSSMRQVVGHGLHLKQEKNELVCAVQEEFPPGDSDSSLCGSDGGGSSTGSNRSGSGQSGDGLLARLRITVLHTLEAIAHHFPRSITSSVGLYLPEQSTPFMTLFNHTPSVLTLLLADPSERVRVAAAKFLEAFWEKVPLKQYFRHSSSVVAPSTSFASMPKRISYMLYQVHVTLAYCLQHKKGGTAPFVQALKTTTSVVQHCPYANVSALLNQSEVRPSLGEIMQVLASSLYAATATSDHSVRMASIACLSALLNLQDPIPSLLEWMVTKTTGKQPLHVAHVMITCGTPSLSKRSFAEELLLIASRPDDSSRSLIRVEAMSLLSKIAKNYHQALTSNWKRLADFMLCAFQDMDPNVRLQAVKIMENYVKGCSDEASKMAKDAVGSAAAPIDQPEALPPAKKECLDFMATNLIRAFHDTSHHVRASVCACFTLLRAADWSYLKARPSTSRLVAAARAASGVQSLETYTRIFLQTPKDSSPVVRAAGFRLLGSLCLTPMFKTRELAIAVVTAALESLSDSTLNVRVRAAWALGNVCTTQGPCATPSAAGGNSGAELEEEGEGTVPELPPGPTPGPLVFYELLPAYQLRNIVEKMLVYINDNDKVASSVARTLGLVGRWAYFEPFVANVSNKEAHALQDLLAQSMGVLAAKINSGSPKVRWNACHAIAKVLLCPDLPLATVHWAPTVFDALINAMAQQENFKVRISACSALRVPVSRSSYGFFYAAALGATMDALETASDLKDVTEFRYKEQLETQLSFTLVHLIHVASHDDDAVIWQAVQSKPPTYLYDWLYHNLHRMTAAIDKENEQALYGEDPFALGQDESHDGGGMGAGGSGAASSDLHDVTPIRKDEILSAVCTLVRILQHERATHLHWGSCLSMLYDAKLQLEHEVLYSNEDLAFEF